MRGTILISSLALALLQSPAFAYGPGSTGGGNGVNNAPIDHYVFDPNKEGAAGRLFITAFQTLGNMSPTMGIFIDKKLRQSTWYMVPRHFREIPERISGIPFSSSQYAIQNFDTDEIWVDEGVFRALSVNNRALLLIHELSLNGAFSKQDYDEATGAEGRAKYVALSESRARRIAAFISNPRNQKLDRVSYLTNLYDLGARGVLTLDYWCSKVVDFDPQQSSNASGCAELTDVNSQEKLAITRTSSLYTAPWPTYDFTHGSGHAPSDHSEAGPPVIVEGPVQGGETHGESGTPVVDRAVR